MLRASSGNNEAGCEMPNKDYGIRVNLTDIIFMQGRSSERQFLRNETPFINHRFFCFYHTSQHSSFMDTVSAKEPGTPFRSLSSPMRCIIIIMILRYKRVRQSLLILPHAIFPSSISCLTCRQHFEYTSYHSTKKACVQHNARSLQRLHRG